jgi:hypothetical protein
MNRGKKWTQEEEGTMLQYLERGHTISDCAQQQGRSVKALYLRLGSILQARGEEIRERLPQGLLQRAVEIWTENENNPPPPFSGGDNATRSGVGGGESMIHVMKGVQDIKDALETLRVDVRKLRVQVKQLSGKSSSSTT